MLQIVQILADTFGGQENIFGPGFYPVFSGILPRFPEKMIVVELSEVTGQLATRNFGGHDFGGHTFSPVP
jgi:hypothetical protein